MDKKYLGWVRARNLPRQFYRKNTLFNNNFQKKISRENFEKLFNYRTQTFTPYQLSINILTPITPTRQIM